MSAIAKDTHQRPFEAEEPHLHIVRMDDEQVGVPANALPMPSVVWVQDTPQRRVERSAHLMQALGFQIVHCPQQGLHLDIDEVPLNWRLVVDDHWIRFLYRDQQVMCWHLPVYDLQVRTCLVPAELRLTYENILLGEGVES